MNNTTEIAFILDKSGSMQSIAPATIQGFNDFIIRQQKEHEELPVTISLTLFDTEFSQPFASISAPEVPLLNGDSYIPDGGTALLDAIGITIKSLGEKLSKMPESERPGKVVVCILTDGEENSSKTYNWLQISEMIKHQKEAYSWDFLFLGANQDSIATASRMNIDRRDSSNILYSMDGASAAFSASERNLRQRKMRMMGSERTPMEDLVKEENAKRQK